MQNQLEEVIKEKKNPTNSKTVATRIKMQQTTTEKHKEVLRRHNSHYRTSILNGIIQERLSNR